jgi:hypothetical protein
MSTPTTIAKRKVDGKTVIVPYKGKTMKFVARDVKEAKFVFGLDRLTWHSTYSTFQAVDPNSGSRTMLPAIISRYRAGEYK